MEILRNPDPFILSRALNRPQIDLEHLNSTVNEVFEWVREKGDAAVRSCTQQFDNTDVQDSRVSQLEIDESANGLGQELKDAMGVAYNNIEKFHKAQKVPKVVIETTTGVQCWRQSVPIQKVGLYIPGRVAPLFSTVLMLGIPAQIAGCQEVILASPPDLEGNIHPAILYAAQLTGISRIFKVGGIQAIAAMAIGTESIPKMDKIFGPGNQYVTAAKRKAQAEDTAIDLPAGPSEVLVVGDKSANPVFIAADLLSQAEHGADSQVLFVTWEEGLISPVAQQVEEQLKELPRREMASRALENSKLILVGDKSEALAIINQYGPEHLILNVEEEEFFLEQVQNAGSVFLGNYTPESAGDYASGTNHTLPTNGFARCYSGVSLDSFVKKITYQKISREGLALLGPTIVTLARAEELEGHGRAVAVRLNRSK